MRIITSGDSWASVYDTLGEAAKDADAVAWQGAHSKKEGNVEWTGTPSWAAVKPMIREGLPDLGRKIAVTSSRIALDLFQKTPHPDISYDVQGQVIDMGRYLEGDPYCVLNMDTPDAGLKRTCEIVVNMSFHNGVNAAEVLNRGTAIASIVKTLEAQGVSCRIWMTWGFISGSHAVSAWVRFKDFGEPLRINQLAFLTCHLSSHRRLGFALGEKAPEALRERISISPYGCYGRPGDLDSFGRIPVDKDKVLYFKIANNLAEFQTVEKAQDYVREVVSQKMGGKQK